MKKKIRVLVLYGGRSAESDVSRISASAVRANLDGGRYKAVPVFLDKKGKWLKDAGSWPKKADVCFPVLHGPMGEDGTVQGLLELLGMPYVGCGVLASAVGMDKEASYRLLEQAKIELLPYFVLREGEERLPHFGWPVFVKPCRLGSSVGVSRAENPRQFQRALKTALKYDDKILVQKAIPAREIECAVLGDSRKFFISHAGEIIPNPRHLFYTYEAKYLDPGWPKMEIPASLSDSQTRQVQELAGKAFAALECHGMARMDFLMDKKSGRIYFNEVNTIPGFTQVSMYPKLWQASGISFSHLLDRLIELAFQRHSRQSRLLVAPPKR